MRLERRTNSLLAALQHALGLGLAALRHGADSILAVTSAFRPQGNARLEARGAELERLNQALREQEAARAFLLKETINAQEAERKRVARQLHDDLAQSLSALVMCLDALEPQVAAEPLELREQLARTRALVGQALDQIRHLMLDLRPSMLDDLGLVAALRWYAESHLRASGAIVVFSPEGKARRLAPETETAIFRIAQEAINNAARHARARQVTVRLAWQPAALDLVVEDDGQGFDPDLPPRLESGVGLGLLGMAERAAIIGASLSVDSWPGGGTRVALRLSLVPDDDRTQPAGAWHEYPKPTAAQR